MMKMRWGFFAIHSSVISYWYCSQSEEQGTFESLYRPRGPLPKLATIVRLRLMQHKLHRLRLRQAKVTLDLLEIQEVGFNTRLELAIQQWKECLANPPSASSSLLLASSPSRFQIMLPPSQTYRLPRNAVPRYVKTWKLRGPIVCERKHLLYHGNLKQLIW
jgi:hypothetical protein